MKRIGEVMNNLVYFGTILIIVVSSVLYHLFQKYTPANVNPAISLSVTYAIAMIACLIYIAIVPPKVGITTELKAINWASYGLAVAILGIEFGYLAAYRAGWNINLGSLVSNVIVAVILIPLGALLFKEHLSGQQVIGIIVCIGGLVLVNWK